MVMQTLESLTNPHPFGINQGQGQVTCCVIGTPYFHIYAERVENLTLDLQRIRWVEELCLVRLFCFFKSHPGSTVVINGSILFQNRWMYDLVAGVIPIDRIAVMGRGTSFSNPESTLGLPQLPDVYRTLEVFSPVPYYVYTPTHEFYGYEEIIDIPPPEGEFTSTIINESFSGTDGEGSSIEKYNPIPSDDEYVPK